MADPAAVYVLTTPGGTITFNSGTDQYFVEEVPGLGGAPVRTPMDDVPFGHGALIYDFWKGPRRPVFDGIFLIASTRVMNNILIARNTMEEDLRVATESIYQADGTLAWTPMGESARSLTVRCEIPLECAHRDNYLLRTFHFGLIAADPDW